MKKPAVLLIVLATLIWSVYAATSSWTVKEEKVKIKFALPEEGTTGILSGLKATIDFDERNPANSKITASVDIKTINTKVKDRDDHLKTSDFFDAEKFPAILFTSTEIKATEKGFIAAGNLQIKEVVKQVEIPFTFKGKKKKGVFKGSLTIYCSDFGVTKKSKDGKDKVVIDIEVPVTK